MSRDYEDRPLSTADLAGMTQNQQPRAERHDTDTLRDQHADPMQVQHLHDGSSAALHAQQPAMQEMAPAGHQMGQAEPLAALFPPEMAQEFRSRWDAVQIGFVDDPQRAVQQADELVAQVMKSLAESFAQQRSHIEAGVRQAGHAATENQRIALQRYRSFFQRLLTL
jgi:ornithine carbamoyltransferase